MKARERNPQALFAINYLIEIGQQGLDNCVPLINRPERAYGAY